MLETRLILLALALGAAACATNGPRAAEKVAIESLPSGASVSLPDGQHCTTPCTVRAQAHKPVQVTFNKPGCLTQSQLLTPEPERASESARHSNALYARLKCDGVPTVRADGAVSAG